MKGSGAVIWPRTDASSKGRRRRRRGHLAACFIAMLAMVAALLSAVAREAGPAMASPKPPPIPECYYTGSGYGSCEGNTIPAGGSVTTLTTPDDKGDFFLTGPAPLQYTQHVACGSDGCIYNHLDWAIGIGATVVKGCAVNHSDCEVNVPPSPTWTPVYVRQNNEAPHIWLLWSPPDTGALIVSIAAAVPPTGLPVGQAETVAVTVTAGPAPLSSVDLRDITSNNVQVVAQPPGASDFSLAAGASRTFDVQIKGVIAGPADLSSQASGTTANGQAVQGSATDDFTLTGPALAITLATSPAQLKLTVNDKGEVVPGKVTVTVTFTNTTKATIATAQLLLLAPVPVVRSQRLNQLALAKDSLPLMVGPFPPSSHASRKFTLAVTGDGKYQWRALALYPDASKAGGNGRTSAIGGAFEATVPLLYFTADIHRDAQADTVTSRNGYDWVKGGDQWYVGGQVKDLSSYQPICLSPLIANTDGNADAVGLQDVSTHNAGDPEPPVAGLIKPDQSYPLGMLVVTSSTGSTNGSVDVPVKGFMADPGASCELQADGTMSGAGAALTEDQTDITSGSTSYVVHVDVSVSPDITPTSGVVNFFGGYAAGSFAVFATIAKGLVAMAKSFRDDPQFYLDVESAAYNPLAAQRLLERANAHMMAITALMVNYLQTTIPDQSDDPSDFVYKVLDKVANDAYAKVAEGSKAITQQFAGNLVKAYETGSAAQIWNAWGNFLGEGAGNVVTGIDLQLFIEGAGSLMTAEAPELEAASKAATEEPAVLTTSKGGVVKAGRVLSLADQLRAWGFSEDTVNKLDQISQKYGVLIGARSRQAISTELEGLGAVWKSSNFHQKTVSAIDQLYLGMDGIRKGLLGFRSFTPAGEAYARRAILEANLPAAEETEALMRLKGRFAENGEDFTHIEQMLNTVRKACSSCPETKGWTNAGFNATGSGRATSSVTRWRRFAVKETPILAPDGTVLGTLYEPLEENIAYASAPKLGRSVPALCKSELGTVLCPITGDIDLVYITNLLGGSLSSAKMLEVFAALDEAGFAHTDLVTWIDQQSGSFFFKDKLDQLAGLVEGKESTVQFAPDGKQRATYLAPLKQSIATGPNSYQLTILGTYTLAMH